MSTGALKESTTITSNTQLSSIHHYNPYHAATAHNTYYSRSLVRQRRWFDTLISLNLKYDKNRKLKCKYLFFSSNLTKVRVPSSFHVDKLIIFFLYDVLIAMYCFVPRGLAGYNFVPC